SVRAVRGRHRQGGRRLLLSGAARLRQHHRLLGPADAGRTGAPPGRRRAAAGIRTQLQLRGLHHDRARRRMDPVTTPTATTTLPVLRVPGELGPELLERVAGPVEVVLDESARASVEACRRFLLSTLADGQGV